MIETFAQIISLAQHSFLFLKAYILSRTINSRIQLSTKYTHSLPADQVLPKSYHFSPMLHKADTSVTVLKVMADLTPGTVQRPGYEKKDGNEYLY